MNLLAALLLDIRPSPTAQPPETVLSSARGEVVLNGIWQFRPEGLARPASDWGTAWAPGDWRKSRGDRPGVVETGADWRDLDGDALAKATYRRTVRVPAHWQGRDVRLILERVSTDAEVTLDGQKCGSVSWPSGSVDLTNATKPGTDQVLEIHVVATADAAEVPVLMGVGQVSKTKADLAWRGIMGDVVLSSRPRGGRVEGVFVQTSTRTKMVGVEVELSGEDGTVHFDADMLNERGVVEKSFSAEAPVKGGKVFLKWPWADPRLWDLDQPNLYTLRLRARGKGLDDEYRQPFGFREFWVEGKRFYLNGTRFDLRPSLGYEGGVPAVSEGHLRGMRRAGYNIQEVWPNNDEQRGYVQFWKGHVEAADRVGMPLMGPSTHMDPVVSWWHEERWSNPAERAKYLAAYERSLREYRNHPSILLWANSGNNFGSNDDQSPTHLGRGPSNPVWQGETKRWKDHHAVGAQVYAVLRRLDPTRPIMAHQGGPLSDVYTANTYLNFLPLQEREEWLSAWAATGEKPYSAVEFGTPLNASFFRSRVNWPEAQQSEPLVTEYASIYFGPEAFRKETAAYRKSFDDRLIEGQRYRWPGGVEEREWGFQSVEALFVRNTWRSWRTWGVSGGMVPWTRAHGYESSGESVALPAWKPGERGLSVSSVRKAEIDPYVESSMPKRPAGVELERNNGDVLAWIAGRGDRWTEKGHHFADGERVEKTAMLINDTRAPRPFDLAATVVVGGKVVGRTALKGELAVGERRHVPLRFAIPKGTGVREGSIVLNATIGGQRLTDRFPFRAVAEAKPLGLSASLFDPGRKTGALLRRLGVSTTPWNGKAGSGLLIVGREAMTSGKPLPGDLRSFAAAGGRVLVLAQRREWLRDSGGFRVAQPLARRAFPVAFPGFDPRDLADWRGASTLVEPYPDFRKNPRPVADHSPTYGWRWGNEGAVAGAALEKPHLSGWRPLIETEFDLAYSPLMQLAVGKGRITLCTLDLEDHASDPMARRVAAAALRAAAAPVTTDRMPTLYVGGASGAGFVRSLGLNATVAATFVPAKSLVVFGPDAAVTDAALKRHLGMGGKALFLARQKGAGAVTVGEPKSYEGAVEPPSWPEAAGLSLSDLRFRAPSLARPLTGGCEMAANGLLGRLVAGKGAAIWVQFDPNALNADRKTYLRATRWRQTRTIVQILANLGATFRADDLFLTKGAKGLYHPDFRTDFDLGDDPYRYFRW